MTAADHDWLDLRAPYDGAAREHSLDLVAEAVAALRGEPERPDGDEPLTVIDIGAGTGNSARWFDRALRPRLGGRPIRWVLLDADQASLDAASRQMPEAVTVTAPITELPRIAAEHLAPVTASGDRPPSAGTAPGRLLISCSAVLDVLTAEDVDAVVDTLVRFSGVGLFLLSITESWPFDPPDRRDVLIEHAFSAHQARDGRLGDTGGAVMAAAAQRAGARVVTGASPWELESPADGAFLTRFLRERVDAVIEEDPELRPVAEAWLGDRLVQAGAGMRATVDHLDVLVDARDRDRGTTSG